MSKDFDINELDEFAIELLELADKKMPNETKKFLQREGNKLRRLTLKNAKSLVKKDTGNYFEGIKRGKVYKYEGDQTSIRVYNSSPHAHLLEDGHRMVTHDGREVGFVRGYRVFDKSAKEFEQEFMQDCEDFIDELLDKGLK
ncbi:HK97 gp10 family phage protein [Brevibacillus agri]|uniref:HK97 gp10 family phage protein n=1 Tax=Brevibacillus agri TaxID=51101 RepID=UPI0025B70D05|nr:HK97 gp10 family phage protein [Brevibacillus agri]MDN4093572.1 HK97 gp10 family phage protein [Brevibacillus agri]